MKCWMNKFDVEEQTEEQAVCSVEQDRDTYIDYRKLHYKNTMLDNRVLVFLTGFCIGMVFFYLSGGQNTGGKSLLDREHLLLLQSFEVNQSEFLMYTLGLRVKQLLFMVICVLSSIGGLLAYSIMGWCGFEVGLLIFSLVYQYGVKGIFLTFSMFLPHGIFYCMVFLIVFRKYWSSNTKCCHNEETIKNKKFHQRMENIKAILLVLLIFGVGILCEIYINPEIMRKWHCFSNE